jgi:hypothetical protein
MRPRRAPVGFEALHEHLDRAAGIPLPPVQARGDDAGVVEHQQITGRQPAPEITEGGIGHRAGGAL